MAEGVWRWGKREIIYLSLHCHHQNDSCVKMGSDESHFNVSLIARDKVTRRCLQTTTFEEKGKPKRGIEPRSLCLPAYPRLTARPNRLTASRNPLRWTSVDRVDFSRQTEWTSVDRVCTEFDSGEI